MSSTSPHPLVCFSSRIAYLTFCGAKWAISEKNPNRRGEGSWRHTFLTSLPLPPWNFKICHCTPTNPGEKKLSPLEILQNCVTLFGNSKIKFKTHGNFAWVFLEHPWKFHCFFNWPLEFPQFFFNTPGNSMSSTPPTCLDFFWNSPMNMDVTPKNCYGAMADLPKHNLLW